MRARGQQRDETPEEYVAPEILALAAAIARGLAREHHEAEQRQHAPAEEH